MYVYIELAVNVSHVYWRLHRRTYMFICDYNAFRSIESLCWIVAYGIHVTTVKLKSAFRYPLNPVHFMFTTTLHHITNATPLYKRKAATILKCNKNHYLFTQKSKDNFKEVS